MKIIHTSGKRRRAIARATLRAGTGLIRINGIALDTYQPAMARLKLREPLLLAGKTRHKVNVSIDVKGGGVMGMTEAARLALARALVLFDKKLKSVFLDYDRHLLVQDSRYREPNKPNISKARAKRQKSYR